MDVERLNGEILTWPETHAARRFLEAFIRCRRDCVGCEIVFEGSGRRPVDQEWRSSVDGTKWTFSKFAYLFLSFDVVLDGWLSNSPTLTASERESLRQIPVLRQMLFDCQQAALGDGNRQILSLTTCVLHMLNLWEGCISSRPVRE